MLHPRSSFRAGKVYYTGCACLWTVWTVQVSSYIQLRIKYVFVVHLSLRIIKSCINNNILIQRKQLMFYTMINYSIKYTTPGYTDVCTTWYATFLHDYFLCICLFTYNILRHSLGKVLVALTHNTGVFTLNDIHLWCIFTMLFHCTVRACKLFIISEKVLHFTVMTLLRIPASILHLS
jgi:hypothetical protein